MGLTSLSPRIARETKTVALMIAHYCHHHHRSADLCSECTGLTAYALERLKRCPFQEGKTTCAKCPVHCYQPAMRDKIKTVMRYSGPRMAYRHPILSMYHFIDGRRKSPVNRSKKINH